MHRANHIFDSNDLQHLFKSDNLEKIVELDNFTTSFKLLNYYKKDIEIHKNRYFGSFIEKFKSRENERLDRLEEIKLQKMFSTSNSSIWIKNLNG